MIYSGIRNKQFFLSEENNQCSTSSISAYCFLFIITFEYGLSLNGAQIFIYLIERIDEGLLIILIFVVNCRHQSLDKILLQVVSKCGC